MYFIPVEKSGYVFMDESGNTGSNLIDTSQRYFSYCAVYVDEAARPKVTSLMATFTRQYFGANREIKSSRDLADVGFIQQFIPVLNQVWVDGARFYLGTADKLYMALLKVFHIFFDPEENENVPDSFWQNRELQRRIAEHILTQCGGMFDFRLFQAYYSSPSTVAGEALIRHCLAVFPREVDGVGLHTALAGALRSVESIATSDADATGKPDRSVSATLFHAVLQKIENTIANPAVRIKVIHDNVQSLRTGLENAFRYRALDDEIPPTMTSSEFARQMSNTQIVSLEFQDSRNEPLIWFADLLAGALRKCLLCALDSEPCTEEFCKLALFLNISLVLPPERRAEIPPTISGRCDVLSDGSLVRLGLWLVDKAT